MDLNVDCTSYSRTSNQLRRSSPSSRMPSIFNDDLTSEFLQKIVGSFMFGKHLFAWDSYRCHISNATKKQLKKLQIDVAVIPGGCTKVIQVPGVYWNALFKSKVRQFYENWMLHGEKSYTKSGNL